MVGKRSLRTIVSSLSLISLLSIVTHTGAECVDNPDYRFQDKPCNKLLKKCEKKGPVRMNCPLSCGECTSVPPTTLPPVGSVCEDVSGAFVIEGVFNNNPKTCQLWSNKKCDLEIVQEKCKFSCDLCGGDGGSPTAAPITAAPITSVVRKDCEDVVFKFGVDGLNGGGKKKCSDWVKRCKEQTGKVAKNCPVTCDLCSDTVPCRDKKTYKFSVPNKTTKRNCKMWSTKQSWCNEESGTVAKNCQKSCQFCCKDETDAFPFQNGKKKCPFKKGSNEIKQMCRNWPAYRKFCPKLCGECTKRTQPTRSPTRPPSSIPSAAPSSIPSAAPTVPQCNLVGKLWFPDEPEAPTFHSERLFVTRKEKYQICSEQQRETAWNCTLVGDAEIFNMNGVWSKNMAIAKIHQAFGGTYKFTIQHKFDDKEKEFEISAVPVLNIMADGVEVGEYTINKNKNQQTHDSDGYVNNDYIDHSSVIVTCDDVCNCTSVKSTPICPIRAEVRMPKIDTDPDTPNFGYHRETMSANLNGSDEVCSPDSTITKWCTHEGKAEFYRPAPEYYYQYASISTTESIVIPEAQNKSFDFRINHVYNVFETYYGNDHALNGDITLFVGDMKKKVFKRGIDQDTHIWSEGKKDWVPNPDYDNTISLQVVCDDACDCTIKELG